MVQNTKTKIDGDFENVHYTVYCEPIVCSMETALREVAAYKMAHMINNDEIEEQSLYYIPNEERELIKNSITNAFKNNFNRYCSTLYDVYLYYNNRIRRLFIYFGEDKEHYRTWTYLVKFNVLRIKEEKNKNTFKGVYKNIPYNIRLEKENCSQELALGIDTFCMCQKTKPILSDNENNKITELIVETMFLHFEVKENDLYHIIIPYKNDILGIWVYENEQDGATWFYYIKKQNP